MQKRFLFILILLFSVAALPQSNYNKVGGVGFRLDDSQSNPYAKLDSLVKIFNHRGLKFTYAVSFGYSTTPALLGYLPGMQNLGFEIADHTPDHETRLFYLIRADTTIYSGRAGVDHISVSSNVAKVCLKVGSIEQDTYTGEGLIQISGNTVTSVNPNEFFDIKLPSSSANPDNADLYSMNAIYIPALGKIFKFLPGNVTANTITSLKSFWDEEINLNPQTVSYDKLKLYDVNITIDAHRLMAERTQRMCDLNGISRPKSWVQPGAYHPEFYKGDIAEALIPMGYSSGGVFADPSVKCFNEYDPDNTCRFGINWEDFSEDYMSLIQMKKIIADRFAKHYVTISRSHLLPNYGLPNYYNRVDSLLDWCQNNNISIKRLDQWADILYNTPQNPYINVMPKLEIDLDTDGKPDGFFASSTIVNEGVPESSNKSFQVIGNSTVFRIYDLGGIEKGMNYFGIWIKGVGQVQVEFNPDWSSQSQYFTFYSNSRTDFVKSFCLFQVPTTNSAYKLIQVTTINTGSDTIEVSGLELRKNSTSQILPPWLDRPIFSNSSIPLVWEDNSNNETGFRVKRKFEGQNNYTIISNNLLPNTTNWVDNLLDFPDSLRTIDSINVYYEIEVYNSNTSITSNLEFIKIKTNDALPVELSSFKASYKNNQVQILWRTETEVNNYGFDLERKSESEWEKIEFISGYGNSNSPKEYSYIDKKPIGGSKLFYRLKQIDNDGKYSYSDEIEIGIVPNVFSLEQNYPNPFNPSTKIRYQLPEKSIVNLKIYNALGEEVVTLLNETKEVGNYEVEVNGANLSSGIYFYRMQAGSYISTKKMVIIK